MLCIMLWSQIKLTSYDFSDFHITGRFLRFFSCMFTYRTGAGRRLYTITSADARPGTVRCRTVPGRRCKRSAEHRTVPGQFYTNFYVQWYIHLYQNSPPFPPKKQVVNIRKIEADSDRDVEENHTCSKLHKFQKKLDGCMLIILSCSKEKYFFILLFLVFISEISMNMQYLLLQKHVASHRWHFDS